MCPRRIAGGDGQRLHLRIEDVTRLDLVPVVVLGIDPEHRDGRDPVLGLYLFRKANRGEGLQQREERSAEEPGLLTGDEGDGLRIPESGGCRGRGFRRPAAALLSQDEIGDRGTLTGKALSSSDGVTPGRRILGIAGKEVGDARMIEDVVGGETPDPRKSADIDGEPGARSGVPGTCTRVGACLGRQT